MPMIRPPQAHTLRPDAETLEVEILDLGEGLQGFARHPDGRAIWVKGVVAPGDTVRIRMPASSKAALEIERGEVIKPSPLRVEPACPYFGVCGGCSRQHLAYSTQLEFKRKSVADALRHIGRIEDPPVAEAVPSDAAYGYRNKIDFSVSEVKRNRAPWQMGYHTLEKGRPVIDIDRCPLASDEMNRVAVFVRDFLRARRIEAWQPLRKSGLLRSLVVRRTEADGAILVNLITGRYRADLARELAHALKETFGPRLASVVNTVVSQPSTAAPPDEVHVLVGAGTLAEKIGGLEFVVSANAFMQVNTPQMERLYALALDMAEILPGHTVLDLYCGAGALTLLAAKRAERVMGLEANPSAVADAEANAQRLGVDNARFALRDLAGGVGALGDTPDVVLADPPRGGMDAACLDDVIRLEPARLVYVSCHPGSLARDARRLTASGYRLERAVPVDLFPQTHHIETLALFRRNSNFALAEGGV